jgi:TorA maturation chaperone TorD
MTGAAPMQFVPTLPPEEIARANFYGLLARLLYAPPDTELLRTLAISDELDAEDGGGIALAWRELARAAAAADAEGVRDEYESTFVSVGKAPITLYTSAYSVRFTNEAPLVALRSELAGYGIARRGEAGEPEDHIAALFEVMRYLISEKRQTLEEQRRFFERWIWPTVQPLCAAIQESDKTAFYKTVGVFLLELCTLEHEAFEML